MVDRSWCVPTPISQSCSLLKNLPISLSPFPCFLSVPFRFRNVSCMADSPTLVNARYYLSVHLFYSASPNTNDRWHASRGGQTDRQAESSFANAGKGKDGKRARNRFILHLKEVRKCPEFDDAWAFVPLAQRLSRSVACARALPSVQ